MSDKIFGATIHKPPTPRTDERVGRGHTYSPNADLVFADFARELERELAEQAPLVEKAIRDLAAGALEVRQARNEILRADTDARRAITRCAELEAEVSKLRGMLGGAEHALRSYQSGNSSPELAESIANHISKMLSKP